jgi:hypothetical protein
MAGAIMLLAGAIMLIGPKGLCANWLSSTNQHID